MEWVGETYCLGPDHLPITKVCTCNTYIL